MILKAKPAMWCQTSRDTLQLFKFLLPAALHRPIFKDVSVSAAGEHEKRILRLAQFH